MGLSMEKITTFIAYWLAVGLAYFGAMSPENWRCMWVVCAPFYGGGEFLVPAQNLSLPDRNGNRQRGDP